MSINTYSFRLDSMHVNFQRGKDPDQDLVSFVVQVGAQMYGPITGRIPTPVHSGDTVNFVDVGLESPPGTTSWQIGPIEIDDLDLVSVGYSVVNTSDTDAGGLSLGDDIKIASAFAGGITTMTGAIVAATGVGAVAGVIVAGAGVVISIIGEILGDIFGHEIHCNGAVLADKEDFSGIQLAQLIGPVGFGEAKPFTIQYQNPDSPDECGHPPDTLMTWSIINETVLDVFGGGTPLLPTVPPTPVMGSKPQDWVGDWGEKDILEDSLVNVRIDQVAGTGRVAGTVPFGTKAAVPGLRAQLGADPRFFVPKSAVPITASPLPYGTAPRQVGELAAVEHLFSEAHQRVSLTERDLPESGAILAQKSDVEGWDLPMIAPARAQDVFNLPTNTAISLPLPPAGSVESKTSRSSRDRQGRGERSATSSEDISLSQAAGRGGAARVVGTTFADSLSLGDGVTLQMYGDYDANHALFRRHVRYLRTQSDGRVISDVMLSPSQSRPR